MVVPPSLPACEALEPRCLMSAGLPRPDHVVIVVEENQGYDEVLGERRFPFLVSNQLDFYHADPFIRELAKYGASLTDMHALRHPSLPN